MVVFSLTLIIALAGCGKGNTYKAPPPPPVTTSKPVLMPMTTYLNATGNTVAINSVDLVARVSGYLDSVDYTDGSVVKKGAKLFVIEQPPYAAALMQAQATLAQAKAQVIYAQAQYDRQLQMLKQNATSVAKVQEWLSQRDSAEAQVTGAIASVEIAKINYGYTVVSAPFDGRVSRHLVDPGNLVGNGVATKLATIEQLAPIYVYFNINEMDVLKIRAALMARGQNLNHAYGEPVEIGLSTETNYPYAGRIDYVSTGLDPSTGTFEVRAVLDNANHALLPGLFVRVQVPLGLPVKQLALPDSAIQSDQAGPYVYVLGAKNVVILKRVKTGVENAGMTAVTGLAADDKVITGGLQNAAPGATVAPTEQDISVPTAVNQG
jgi:RND family efflux transporter MFP subunit